jgi:cullin 1
MGSDLYNNLIAYFVGHLRTLRDVRGSTFSNSCDASRSFQASDPLTDENLLRYYAGEWDRYTIGANYINRLFTYLNRQWVKREKDKGRKNVHVVYTVSIKRDTRKHELIVVP